MTCGIYVLRFTGTDKVYVGQSIDIEYRFKKHIQRLKRGDHNTKMNNAFKKYGEPYLDIILPDVPKAELNTCELEAFNIFDSVNNGFNVADKPDIYLEGEDNPAAILTNEKVREVFKLLLDPYLKYADIEKTTGVALHNIRHIFNGEAHTWLKDEFPEDYLVMRSIDRASYSNSARAKGKIYPKVISPVDGSVHEVYNASQFARANNMDTSYFTKLLNGKADSCKGWKVLK